MAPTKRDRHYSFALKSISDEHHGRFESSPSHCVRLRDSHSNSVKGKFLLKANYTSGMSSHQDNENTEKKNYKALNEKENNSRENLFLSPPPPYRRKTSTGYFKAGRDDAEDMTATPSCRTPPKKEENVYLSPVKYSSPKMNVNGEFDDENFPHCNKSPYFSPNPFSPHYTPRSKRIVLKSPMDFFENAPSLFASPSRDSKPLQYSPQVNDKSFDDSVETSITDSSHMSIASIVGHDAKYTPASPANKSSFSIFQSVLCDEKKLSRSILFPSFPPFPSHKETSPTDALSFPYPRHPLPRRPIKEGHMRRIRPKSPQRSQSKICENSSRFSEDFDTIGTLGTGSFGTVYECMSKLDGCYYAIKIVKQKATGEKTRERILKEVYALAALCAQADTATFHIVRYHQAWMEENQLYIQTELCTSTLRKEMENGTLDELKRHKCLRELLLALELLHKNGMVHLDIKPENVFIRNNKFKLGDFGLVHKTDTTQDVEEGDSRYISLELLSSDLTQMGDLTKCDIFSLGVTIYETLIFKSTPLQSCGEQWRDIRHGKLMPIPDISLEFQKIISDMLQSEPKRRPSAKNLLGRNLLLSDDKKQLILERNKARAATQALQFQQQKFAASNTGIHIHPKRKLVRSSTWNVGMDNF